MPFGRGFINIFVRRATGFHKQAKLFKLTFEHSKKNFPLDGQTRRAKSSSQPVNLPCTPPLLKPLYLTNENILIENESENKGCSNLFHKRTSNVKEHEQ